MRGTQAWGSRMEGADESTELIQHPLMMQVFQGIMYIIATLCLNVTIHEACFSPLKCFNSAKHSYCKLKFVDDFAPGQKLL